MITREHVGSAVIVIGTAISIGWAAMALWNLYTTFAEGGGSFGSADVSILLYLVPVVVTGILTGVTESRGYPAVFLRRSFWVATATPIVLNIGLIVAAFTGTFGHGVRGIWIVWLVGAMASGALWMPVQTFFVTAFLGLAIKPPAIRA